MAASLHPYAAKGREDAQSGKCLGSCEEGEDNLEMEIAEELRDKGGVQEQSNTGEQTSPPDHAPLNNLYVWIHNVNKSSIRHPPPPC